MKNQILQKQHGCWVKPKNEIKMFYLFFPLVLAKFLYKLIFHSTSVKQLNLIFRWHKTIDIHDVDSKSYISCCLFQIEF